MAGGTSGGHVFARERKFRGAMIELAVQPIGCRVAQLAILGKSGGRMRRIVRALIILQVAGIARCAQRSVVVVDVAQGAIGRDVLARKRKLGRVVIERRIQPGYGAGVARAAIVAEAGGRVRRMGGAVVILQMAAITIGRDALKFSAHMALGAGERRVRAHQGEAGKAGMIEPRSQPALHSVAQLALGRKIGRPVIHRLRGNVILQMAAIAVGV